MRIFKSHGKRIPDFTWEHGSGSIRKAHKTVYETILKRSGAKLRQASTGNDNITVRERFTNQNSAILFAGNFYNEDQTGKVTYTHPETGEAISIPYSKNEVLWPALYGILTPVCLDISDGLKVLHSTSDILGIEAMHGQIEITLYGDRDLAGEIVFEGTNVDKILSATLGGRTVKMFRDNKRVALLYSHKHKSEMTLTINFS
jgi:hypothetical protein